MKSEVPVSDTLPMALYVRLTDQAKAKLAKRVPALFPQKSGDHVTVAFEPTEAEVNKFPKGKRVTLTVTHVLANDRVQAVRVVGVETRLGTPHVTISWATGASPVEANDLMRQAGTPLQPWLKLEGVYDYEWGA